MTHVNLEQSDAETELLLRLRATPEIFDLIRHSTTAQLSSQRELRDRFDTELVRAALSVHDARMRAAGLLPRNEELWLTRVGLEQCTAWNVAQHKAQRFHEASHVVDLCCGIGVDAASLSSHPEVTAVDCSPAMCVRTAWNAEVWGTASRLQTRCQDVASSDWKGQTVHADPDRRSDSDRPTKRLEQYQPNLEWMQQLTQTAAAGAIKVSPASNFLQKFPGCEIELISLHGECREATVWFGSLAGEHSFRATILPTGETICAEPLSVATNTTTNVGTFLFDPNPAIVRSGLLDVMAQQHQLLRLDNEEEYLTGDRLPGTGFVTAFQVEVVLSNSMKDLKRYLRTHPSQHYEIKCRRISTETDVVRRQLPRGDESPRVILFARVAGHGAIVVARRIPPVPSAATR